MTAVLAAEDVSRHHGDVKALEGFSLAVAAAESVAIVGPSGCGKSTLLQVLGLLDRPTSGRVLIDGADAYARPASARARLRLVRLGFVFQQNNLLEHLTARENVAVPAWSLGGDRGAALRAADDLLERFGLSHRGSHRAGLLSVGEAQRVAIARALVNRPGIVLADEPTGSLDAAAGAGVLAALEEVCSRGAALIVVTHDPRVAARAGRTVRVAGAAAADPLGAHGPPPG
jgi:putative ABC transport system ATP-binding protein